MPKVLISDELSDAAVQIFKDRGVEVDFQPTLGKDPAKLAKIIGTYEPATEPSGPRGEPPITPGTPEHFEVEAVLLDIGPTLPGDAIEAIQKEVLERMREERCFRD